MLKFLQQHPVVVVLSILGTLLPFLAALGSDSLVAWIALGVLASFAAWFAGVTGWHSFQLSRAKYPKGWRDVLHTAELRTENGKDYDFEVLRVVQSKRPLQSCFEYHFRWTGDPRPSVESDRQELLGVSWGRPDGLDRADLRFAKPLLRDQCEIVHLRIRCSDASGTSKPHLATRVELPTECIVHRYAPGHLASAPPARLFRRSIENPQFVEALGTRSFDPRNRCYEWRLQNPAPGFVYVMEWDR